MTEKIHKEQTADKRRQQIKEDKERLQTNAKELLKSPDGQCCRTVAKAIFDDLERVVCRNKTNKLGWFVCIPDNSKTDVWQELKKKWVDEK